MADPAPTPYISYEEYLALEEKSLTKHEWLDGVVVDMDALGRARGTIEHAFIIASVIGELGNQLHRRRAQVFPSDLRLRVVATGLATYPDASVVCNKVELDPDDRNAITNPAVLIEVLSDSSEAYDRGEKFAHYRRIPSLREYVLVSQRRPLIEVWRKNDEGLWVLAEEATAGQVAKLASIGCSLSVDEIYADPLRETDDDVPAATPS
ncbi:MAG: Uma2 family endonuclease [Minicystis sp.]